MIPVLLLIIFHGEVNLTRNEDACTALARLKAALTVPGNMLLARARENMFVQRRHRQTPSRPSYTARPTQSDPAPNRSSPMMTPPSATAWGGTAVARQHARNKQKSAFLEQQTQHWQQMANRDGLAVNMQPSQMNSPIPNLLSPKVTAPYRPPGPGPETQRLMEEMEEEEDLQ